VQEGGDEGDAESGDRAEDGIGQRAARAGDEPGRNPFRQGALGDHDPDRANRRRDDEAGDRTLGKKYEIHRSPSLFRFVGPDGHRGEAFARIDDFHLRRNQRKGIPVQLLRRHKHAVHRADCPV